MTTPPIELAPLVAADGDPVVAAATMQAIATADAVAGLKSWLDQLWQHRDQLSDSDPAVLGGLLRAMHTSVLRSESPAEAVRPVNPTIVLGIDEALPKSTPNRHLLMHLLSLARAGDHLHILTRMLIARPPEGWMAVGQVLSPLLQYSDWDVHDFFPDIFAALSHPAVASPVLDVANFLTRSGRVAEHPATDRIDSLLVLLDAVVARLERFEKDPSEFGQSVDQVQAVLSEAIALAVSLCDAVGLIGDDRAKGKLHQALEVKHRRVQSEAAGALARLGDEAGREHLIKLAAEPSARRRVVQYADELEIGDQIDQRYRTPEALAEADVAVWLSQPQQMGVPPTSVEVVDAQTMLWPSYHDPIACFLVRYAYDMGDVQYSNVGLAGPTVHCFAADLSDLSVDDTYAIYAGWHAEHPDIFTVPAKHWNAAQKRVVQPLVDHLDREGYDAIQPDLLGFLLDEHAVVCRAMRDDQPHVVISDGLETISHPSSQSPRPLGCQDLWYLYTGRKMLRTFNA
ncbi:HEAT repeat domain-containing protein [Roseimaritima sediminicola]|uniref:HEAT repeat domain-containing protein n=1 Tax=Roseimaritima sediminicola TaxID=2662066 RepID=UPI0012984D3D|nr:HEAT repeat domain-containing protein [Roseimaritima sediminicola]